LSKPNITWADKADKSDLAGAYGYLTLQYNDKVAEEIVELLGNNEIVTHRACDILRACDLSPLPIGNIDVIKYLRKFLAGDTIGPALILSTADTAELADGLHRISALYYLDVEADVACVVASIGGVNEEDD